MEISKEQYALMNKHLDLVLQANKSINLTSITNEAEAYVLHIEDSLAAVPELENVDGEIVDMGSGGGFPGIPLSIVLNNKFTLVETVGKKADCLKTFISELRMGAKISVSNQRLEELADEKRNYYAGATARALSSLPSLLELASPLLKVGGLLVCYKGANYEEELNNAMAIKDKLGFELESNREYTLEDDIVHRIITFKKINEAAVKLPRKLGFAQKKPFLK